MHCILLEAGFDGPSNAAFIILIWLFVLEKIGKVIKSVFSVVGVKGARDEGVFDWAATGLLPVVIWTHGYYGIIISIIIIIIVVLLLVSLSWN